jgi:M3 family oligoendopeptidase
MKFREFQYHRPKIEEIKQRFATLLAEFKGAGTMEEQDDRMAAINSLRREFESMDQLAKIRHTVDTFDEKYKAEQDYFDEVRPVYQGLITDYYLELVKSPFRGELEEKWGKQLFVKAELMLKTFSQEIIQDLQRENKLTSEYTSLLASAKIMFDGEERNLSQLIPFQLSPDREVRRMANQAKYDFFQANQEKLDHIFDQLVKVRTEIARKLGCRDFVELGYARLCRSDYNPALVTGFREQVLKHIVPTAKKLKERQAARIGLASLKYYDEKCIFPSGNPKPQGDEAEIIANGRKMYRELSPETGDFFDFMVNNELMDLVSKKGKAGGGYCTFISQYSAPFIFSNFNGTSGDIVVLTHEAGHAFQVYLSRNFPVPEYYWPTLDAAEIHSMSMEFFTWPWMELFFGSDGEKFRFMHLSEALVFIPYGVTVDEFQHLVYSQPEMTPAERKKAWRELEKKYLPYWDCEDNQYLAEGNYWHQQGHIFKNPFYYIDYALAQMCSLQFWKKAKEDQPASWSDYLRLCQAGGSKPFGELVELANLTSPFDHGCVPEVVREIENWLNQVDDGRF